MKAASLRVAPRKRSKRGYIRAQPGARPPYTSVVRGRDNSLSQAIFHAATHEPSVSTCAFSTFDRITSGSFDSPRSDMRARRSDDANPDIPPRRVGSSQIPNFQVGGVTHADVAWIVRRVSDDVNRADEVWVAISVPLVSSWFRRTAS
jgi:hypothetical protein